MRTHYDSTVVEIVAPVCLRTFLKLKDGQKVKVEIMTLP
jgi:CTP-dependent riboflavin kinase